MESYDKPQDSGPASLDAGPSEYKTDDSYGHSLSTELVCSGNK